MVHHLHVLTVYPRRAQFWSLRAQVFAQSADVDLNRIAVDFGAELVQRRSSISDLATSALG
jgi:hypothetical protein